MHPTLRLMSRRSRTINGIALAILLVLLGAYFSFTRGSHAANNFYYVSPSGSDSNPGSIGQPFQTIQKCASIAQAGDQCELREGTYRETVTPANSGTSSSPITFEAYNGEAVTVDGADLVTGWTLDHDNVYKASVTANTNLFANQLFVDGLMMNEARWPNTSFDQMRPVRAIAESGTTTTTVFDHNLTQAAGFWIGATIHFWGHEAYFSQTATVTASGPGYVTFTGITGCPWGCTTEYSKYYLSGIKGALDSSGEWYYDNAAHQVYLWTPSGDSPASHTVEFKQRTYAFDLSGKSYVAIKGLRIFSSNVMTDTSSSNNIIDGITARYLTHFTTLPNVTNSFFGYIDPYFGKSGIVLNGTNNTLRNSDIALSAGSGVTLEGNGHIVTNNLIHDLDYMGDSTGGVALRGNGMQVTHNTIYRTGYSNIRVGADKANPNFRNNTLSYNDLFNSNDLDRDGGAIYLCCSTNDLDAGQAVDSSGTVIDHNLVHDSQLVNVNATADYNAAGIYPDNGTHDLVIHHNVLWNNVSEAFHVNPNSSLSPNNLFYNNTVGTGQQTSFGDCCSPDYSGTQIINNILPQPIPGTQKNATLSNNLLQGTDPRFVNTDQNDFHLQPTSPAIDAGKVISPYTDGYIGAAPDIGAYEYGGTDWTAGSTLDTGIVPVPSILDDSRASGQITFNWGRVKGATGYKVHYGTTSESYSQTVDVGNVLSTTLTGLTNNVPYYFAVSAITNTGETPISAERWDIPTGGNRDATQTIYASTFDHASTTVSNHKTYVGDYSLGNGTWLEYDNVDFGTTGQDLFTIDYGSQGKTDAVELHLDSPTGTLIGTVKEKSTGDNYLAWSVFSPNTARIAHTTGVHNLFIVAPNGSGNPASFRFQSVDTTHNAYTRIPAINYNELSGKVSGSDCNNTCLGHLDGGSWVKYSSVDFGTGATSVAVDLAATSAGTLEFHLDSPTGTLLGTLAVQNSGGQFNYIPQRTVISGASGVHDLYIVVPGTQVGVGNFDWLSFGQAAYNTTGNLALNKPATASSTDDPSDDASFGDDGNSTTRWSSAYSDAQWYIVDLGATTTINEYKISWQNGADKPNTYDFQVSNDAQNWTTVHSSTTGGGNEDVTGLNASGRYVRINGVSRTWQYGYTFYELEIYSTSSTTGNVPSPWTSVDIGSPASQGSASYDSSTSTFAIAGSGFDIYWQADGFHYVYQSLNGDSTIIARVASIQNTDSWAKAGVMIRDSLDANAKQVDVVITPGNGAHLQYRASTGGDSSDISGGTATAPYWVKLTRNGNSFTGYISSDGTTWMQIGSITITMGSTAYIGLAVTSHHDGTLNTSTFDNVSVSNSSQTWTKCADEGGTCTVSGTHQVRYGANGHYNYQTVTDSIGCNNSVFGDPIVGTFKECDYQ